MPSNGSTIEGSAAAPAAVGAGASRPHAMAFTVKSRRARSARMSSPNSIRCGRRKSAYSCSLRKVVTWSTSVPRRTPTVPKAFSYTAPGNSWSIRSGFASVARSQSFDTLPRSASRTDPPTT